MFISSDLGIFKLLEFAENEFEAPAYPLVVLRGEVGIRPKPPYSRLNALLFHVPFYSEKVTLIIPFPRFLGFVLFLLLSRLRDHLIPVRSKRFYD